MSEPQKAMSKLNFGKTPRAARNGDKIGKYELIPQISNAVLNRGDTIIIDMFVTGYGQISDGKIHFSLPSSSIHGRIKSIVYHGLKPVMQEGIVSSLVWGSSRDEFDSAFALELNGGIKPDSWPETSLIFDAYSPPTGSHILVSERTLGDKPPFRIEMSFSKKVRPGLYNVNCVLTYYNGESWQNSSFQLPLTVRNLFEEYQGWVSFLGILAALGSSTGIVAMGLQVWQMLHPH
jgi:hypothetical protein